MIDSKTKGRARIDVVAAVIERVPTQLDTTPAHIEVHPRFQGRFSTKVDPHAPENEGVGDCMRDPHEVRNKILEVKSTLESCIIAQSRRERAAFEKWWNREQ